MRKKTHALGQKTNSSTKNMVPSMLGSPHWDFHPMVPSAWGSSEDTSASQIGFQAVVGQKNLLALLLDEWADVRPLIWELCGSPFPADSSKLSQSDIRGLQPGHPPAVHLPWELESAPACHTYLGDRLPADDCRQTTRSSNRNYTLLTAHHTSSSKQSFFTQIGTTTMETCTLTRVWSYFPSCQLQERIPHSYGILIMALAW